MRGLGPSDIPEDGQYRFTTIKVGEDKHGKALIHAVIEQRLGRHDKPFRHKGRRVSGRIESYVGERFEAELKVRFISRATGERVERGYVDGDVVVLYSLENKVPLPLDFEVDARKKFLRT